MTSRPQKQTRRASVIEVLTNILVGYILQVYILYLVAPLFNFSISITSSAGIGTIMTVTSVLRQFSLRRFFEAMRYYGMLP